MVVIAPCEKSDIRETALKEHKQRLLELCIDRDGREREVLPDALYLIELDFAIFGGLSWEREFCRKDRHEAHQARVRDFNHLCKIAFKGLNLNYREVLFFFRDEPSESGEWHAHFLIGAMGIETVPHADLAATLQSVWTKRFNKGMAKIEPFDPNRQLEGVSYVCKVSRDGRGNEIANFPVRSKALFNLIQKKNIANRPFI
jgi:hypothetical protein